MTSKRPLRALGRPGQFWPKFSSTNLRLVFDKIWPPFSKKVGPAKFGPPALFEMKLELKLDLKLELNMDLVKEEREVKSEE